MDKPQQIPKKGNELATDGNVIRIGQKPAINYILATVTIFSQGKKSVILQARGRAISTAVSVEQAVRRRMKNLGETKTSFGTAELFDEEKKRTVRVSTADIVLSLKE
jgi:DNA-binding protein